MIGYVVTMVSLATAASQTITVDERFPWNTKLESKYENGLDYLNTLELELGKTCNYDLVLATYHLKGSLQDFGECSSLNLCNQTLCITLTSSSMFSATLTKHDWSHVNLNHSILELVQEKTGIVLQSQKIMFSVLSYENLQQAMAIREADDLLYVHPTWKAFSTNFSKLILTAETFINETEDEVLPLCSLYPSHILIEQQSDLPTGCLRIFISNQTSTIEFGLSSQLWIKTAERNFDYCNLERTNSRVKRASVNKYSKLEDERYNAIVEYLNKTKNVENAGFLNFNLPGYRYCGPGTDIEKMDDDGGPVNSLDEACRQHDLDYLIGIDPEEADDKLLQTVGQSYSVYYPLFTTVFTAKRAFEHIFKKRYTSSLYVYPNGFMPSKTLHFFEQSMKEAGTNPNDTEAVRLEAKWKRMVQDIWQGSCYAKSYQGSEPMEVTDGETPSCSSNDIPLPDAGPGNSGASSNPTPEDGLLNNNGQNAVTSTNAELKPTPNFNDARKCKRLINEILMAETERQNHSVFIELGYICGKYVPKKSTIGNLNGHMLGIITINEIEASISTMFRFRDGERFVGASESYRNSFYVVGTSEYNSRIELTELDILHAEPQGIVLVVLLYFPKTYKKMRTMNAFIPSRDHNSIPLTNDKIATINEFIVDGYAWGAMCTDYMENTLRRIISDFPDNCMDFVQKSNEIDSEYPSMSRCRDDNMNFQTNSFRKSLATPGTINDCTNVPAPDVLLTTTQEAIVSMEIGAVAPKINYPFKLTGVAFQSPSQKLILNVLHFVTLAKRNPSLLKGQAWTVTANLLGISQQSITNARNRYKAAAILTPGKKRKNPCRKQLLIDSFDRMMIRNIIADMYQKGYPPLFNNIYTAYLEKRHENFLLQRNLHTNQPTSCSAPAEEVQISRQVFVKVLRAIGFKYGRIDTRLAVIQRPDLVILRGKYLKIQKANRDDPNPKKVVYLDETWIDPNQRLTKAWVPSQQWGIRERLKYSFKKHKIGRGPRVILLSAADENGIIEEATVMYSVAKGKMTDDYHDNVNSASFMEYMEKLLNYLDKFEQKSIIVMDNASYHSTRLVPKKSDRKEVFYKWIQEHLNYPGVNYILPPENKIFKWELQVMVETMKQLPSLKNELYKVDQEVAKRGHQIVRLPPYHCHLNPIELAWNTMKQCVQAKNVRQDLTLIMNLAKECLAKINGTEWTKYEQHVRKFEDQHWRQDGVTDKVPQSIVIPVRDDDDDDDDDYDDVVNAHIEDEHFQMEEEYDAVQEESNGDIFVPIDDDIEDVTEAELLASIMGDPIDHEEVVEAETPCPRKRNVKRRRLDFEPDPNPSANDMSEDLCTEDVEELMDI